MPTNNPEQIQQYSSNQEIDLVDVLAILLRRKLAICLTIIIVTLFALGFLAIKTNKYTVSSVLRIGEVGTERGLDQIFEQIMTVAESKQLLQNALLPAQMTKLVGTGSQMDASNIKINSVDDSGNILIVSTTATENSSRGLATVIKEAVLELVAIQNTTLEKKQAKTVSAINIAEIEINFAENETVLLSKKKLLLSRQNENQLLLDKSANNLLLKKKKALLEKILEGNKFNLVQAESHVNSQEEALKEFASSKPMIKARRQELEQQLLEITKLRTKILDSPGTSNIEDALLALDGRDGRYRTDINELDELLLTVIPENERLARLTISIGLANILKIKNLVDIAEHNVFVFDIEQSYSKRELIEISKIIATELSAFDVTSEVEITRLKQEKMSLELMLNQSSNSISVNDSITPLKPDSVPIYIIGNVFAGVFLGCFLAFFLELYEKVKTRVAETANV